MNTRTPPAEVDIDDHLVRRLLDAQHPDLAGLPLRFCGEGWDNVMYRLGDDLSVRLPRRQVVADLIGNEQRWLPVLAPELPLAIPAPVRVGAPSDDYPWSWSILPWLPGEPADLSPPGAGQGVVLADFLRALHRPAPSDAPRSDVRGVPLAGRARGVEERLSRLGTRVGEPARASWADALAAPSDTTRTWAHGDLHGANVLVDDGALTGVIDWVDLNAGDGATDLAAVWMLLDDPAERRFALDRYRPDADGLRRARGWAVLFGAMLLESGLDDNPRYASMGAAALSRLDHDLTSVA